MDNTEKARENRIRAMARRQGLHLVKSRRRDPRALDYGGCMLVDNQTSLIVYGGGYNYFGYSLDDCEAYLLRARDDLT